MNIPRVCCYVIAGVVLVSMAISAITSTAMLAGGFDAIFDSAMQKVSQIVDGSPAYEIWRDVPVPMSLTFYLFNLTNPVEFENGEKPRVEEVGPYVYREYHEKVNISPNHANYTITYFQRRWWIWDQEASGNNTQNDSISLLNVVPVSAGYILRNHKVLQVALGIKLDSIDEKLTVVKPVHEILFDGYEDPLLSLLHTKDTTENTTDSVNQNLGELADVLKKIAIYDKMAWFYKRNNSDYYDGEFNMYTGEDTLANIGLIDWWNKTRETTYFTYPCNKIEGSAGEMWPPNQKNTSISFYCTDLCRTLEMPYKGLTTDKFGIAGYRYWVDSRTFAHPSVVPENQCYCYENDLSNCPPSGLLDAQSCRMGSPALISLPHFLYGDEELIKAVDGISLPDETKHSFYIDMVPEMGVPLEVAARMQINIRVTKQPLIGLLRDVEDVILPMVWFEVSAAMTQEMADALYVSLFLIRTPAVVIFFSVLLAASIFVFFLTVVICYCCQRRAKQTENYERQVDVSVISQG